MHIVLSANQAWNIYNFRRGLVRQLLADGIAVSVVAPRDEWSDYLSKMGCQVLSLPVAAQSANPFADFVFLIRLTCLYRKLKPDLVVHYTIKPNIYGSIAAEILGIPSLAVTTGLGYTFIKKGVVPSIARQLYKIAFRYPCQVWFLNEDDRLAFVDGDLVQAGRTFVLGGEGCDVVHFSPRERGATDGLFRFLLIARLLWDKGIGEYVAAAESIRREREDVVFQLLGSMDDGNPSAVPRELIQSWDRSGLIEYLGTTADVRPAIAQSDCVVLPSYREGVPRVLLEAAAMAKPLIATDAPGCKDVILDGRTGYLCRTRDSNDLAVKMRAVLAMPARERELLGRNGREFVCAHFNEEAVIRRYYDFFRSRGLLGADDAARRRANALD